MIIFSCYFLRKLSQFKKGGKASSEKTQHKDCSRYACLGLNYRRGGLLTLSFRGSGSDVAPKEEETVALDTIKADNPLKVYEAPEQSKLTQFYQKRDWPILTRGMTFYVEDYVGMVEGSDDAGDTNFKTYVVDGESDVLVGYVYGGDGYSNNIILYHPGLLVFNVYANGQVGTFEVTVTENAEFDATIEALSVYERNYTAYQYDYDDDGNEVELTTVYASKNYVYDEAVGEGYLLSKLDDSYYSFTLTDADSDDLSLYKVPSGDKAGYNSATTSLNILQTETAWTYSSVFSSNAALKKFKYCFYYSYSMACRIFSSLGLTSSTYSVSGTTFYPYYIFASYTNENLELLPVMINSDGTYVSYFRPFRLSNPGTTTVAALDSYVNAYSAPEKVDTSEIVNALRYVSEKLNYTISSTITITDDLGNVLPSNSPYLTSNSYFRYLNRHPGTRMISEDAYYGTQFHGLSPNTIPGGYWSYGGVTYDYTYDSSTDVYYTTDEVVDYGASAPYAHWYNYTIMQYYIPTAVMSMTNVRNSYPEYDADTGTYYMTPDLSASLSVMKGVVTMCYHMDCMSSTTNKFYLAMIDSGVLAWNFEYDEEGNVSKIIMTLTMELNNNVFSGLTQDYHYEDVMVIDNIGTTDISWITDQLSVPEAAE